MLDSWERQLLCWRHELKALGHRLESARWDDEIEWVSTLVRDLRVRIRNGCDELEIPTLDDDSIDALLRKIMRRLDEQPVL